LTDPQSHRQMKTVSYIIILILGVYNLASGQKLEVNSAGEKIIKFEDGTWRPYQASDSLLLKKSVDSFFETDDSGIDVLEYPKQSQPAKVSKRFKKRTQPNPKDSLVNQLSVLQNKYDKFSRDPSIPPSDLKLIEIEIETLQNRLSQLELQQESTNSSTETITENLGTNKLFQKQEDFIKSPPLNECSFNYTLTDKVDGKRRSEVSPQFWFSYTNPNLYNLFSERDFLTARVSISEISPYKFLNLEVNFATATAKREYGYLAGGANLTIIFTNGDFISLKNEVTSEGTLDQKTNTTSYKGIFSLSTRDERKLAANPIDKIRLVWSTGFEDYEIYHVDVLMNQLKCLYNL